MKVDLKGYVDILKCSGLLSVFLLLLKGSPKKRKGKQTRNQKEATLSKGIENRSKEKEKDREWNLCS